MTAIGGTPCLVEIARWERRRQKNSSKISLEGVVGKYLPTPQTRLLYLAQHDLDCRQYIRNRVEQLRALGPGKTASECLLLGLFLEKLSSYDSEKDWTEALQWVERASTLTESEEVVAA